MPKSPPTRPSAGPRAPLAKADKTARSSEPAKVTAEGVRRQRQHIQELTGEDPLRGGVAD